MAAAETASKPTFLPIAHLMDLLEAKNAIETLQITSGELRSVVAAIEAAKTPAGGRDNRDKAGENDEENDDASLDLIRQYSDG
jgi:hypothetical protein